MVTDFRSKRRFDAPLSRLGTLGPFHVMVALAAAYALLLTLYLVSDVILVLVLMVAVVAVGTDRLVRLHPQARFHGATSTALYLFLPGIFSLFSALAIGQADNAVFRLLLAVASVILFAVTAIAEYLTVDPDAETYEVARFGLLLSIYVTALFTFIVALGGGFPLLAGVLLVGSVTFLLSVDMLRDLEADAGSLWIQSGAIAAVMAECRWVLYFLPLPDVLAGVFMLVVFYVMTGLIQDSVTGRMNRSSWTTYGGVFLVAAVVVLVARLLI